MSHVNNSFISSINVRVILADSLADGVIPLSTDKVESIKGESFLFKWNLNKQILQITKAYTAKYIPCLQGVKYHGLTHKCISKDDSNEN